MANEETSNPTAGAPKPAPKPAAPAQDTNAGNGDMAHLIGNMGILIDSTIESVQGMINTVSSATGQIMEGVNTTINSDQVKGIIDNVNSVSGQLIEGVTNTLNSEQLQNSFNELGKFWADMISNLNSTVNSDQVKDLFDNVSSGINQLTSMVFSQGMQPPFMDVGSNEPQKKVQEIPVMHSTEKTAPTAKPVPAKPVDFKKPEA